MEKIKKGSYVARKSHDKDVLFQVKKILSIDNQKISILRGLTERIVVDSPIEDLELVSKHIVQENLDRLDRKIDRRIQHKKYAFQEIEPSSQNNRAKEKLIPGKILHLDGDKKYAEKSYYYYKKLGLNAVVRNIPEYKQSKVVYSLLSIHKPDVLVITGHDGMIKRGSGYHDLYNYRNSKHFIDTVTEARKYDKENNQTLVIFAGACQSYFEALIYAGANFASSPARILIDFIDPLLIAEKIAITDKSKFVTIDDIVEELRDGKKGVDGIGAYGKSTRRIKRLVCFVTQLIYNCNANVILVF